MSAATVKAVPVSAATVKAANRRTWSIVAFASLSWGLCWFPGQLPVASAQDATPNQQPAAPPAEQPADQAARPARGATPDQQPAASPGTPAATGEEAAVPPSHTRRAIDRALGKSKPLHQSEEAPELPPGTLEVLVVDVAGNPVPEAPVRVGIMRPGGERDQREAKTLIDGRTTLSDLPTGPTQAYRVNVPFGGATYSSDPFRLPEESGFRVTITRLATTQDDRAVFQSIGQTVIDFVDGRLKLFQQTRLVNFGDETYVFPAEGKRVQLPVGTKAFATPTAMTGPTLSEDGEGFLMRGSLPPGSHDIQWSFDLPYSGSQAEVQLPLAWNTFQYQVLVAAPDGLRMDVEGFPAPTRATLQNGDVRLATRIQRAPTDAKLEVVRIVLTGIPGPGPWRWLAVWAALLLTGLGVFMVWRLRRQAGSTAGRGVAQRAASTRSAEAAGQRSDDEVAGKTQADMRSDPAVARLVEAIATLHREQREGAVGPTYFQERLQTLRDELAAMLAGR